jgi:hypothetical protein
MISTVSLSFDLTYVNPATNAVQPRCIVTDSTDYIGLGLDPVDFQLKGLGEITFNGDIIESHNTVLDPMLDLENWDFSTGNPTIAYNLPLDSNGNVANGVYTFLYRLRVNVQAAVALPITLTPTDLVTFTANQWVSQFLEVGNSITLVEPFVTSETVTVESTAQVGPDGEITVSDYTIGAAEVATFELINIQLNDVYTYSGCTQTTADVSFTYDCEYGDNGIWAVSNTTTLASNEVISSLNCSINYPSWTTLSPTFPGNVVVTSLPYPGVPSTPTPLATGTYSVSLTQQIQQTQTDGLILQYLTSVVKEFAVSCAGTLCGLVPCIENLRVAHQTELIRNRVSKYQVYVDNVLMFYTEAMNYKACGELDKYRQTVDLIRTQLDASGCECACCDDNTYYWVSNNSGESVIESLIASFQFRLFTLDPEGPGSPLIDGVVPDSTQGVEVGALWENVTTGVIYRCINNTPGTAAWEEYYAPGVTPNAEDIPAVPGPILTGDDVQAQLDQIQTLFLFDAINGLSKVGTDVGLGGTLDTDTTINVNGNDFIIESDDSTLEVIATSGVPLLLNVNQGFSGVGINAILTTTNTAGVGANGIGSSIQFAAENAAGSEVPTSNIRSTWTDATAQSSNFQITTKNAGTENVGFTLNANGSVTLNEYDGTNQEGAVTYMLGVNSTGLIQKVATPPAFTTYVALINQTGTADPVLTEIYNDTGLTMTPNRNGAGNYDITSGVSFSTTKTMVLISNGDIVLATRTPCVVARVQAGRIVIETKFSETLTFDDEVLTNACIEVRIYQ